MKHSIAFICSANLCRSPIAHAICVAETRKRGLGVHVLSAGINDFEGALAVREARLVCEKRLTPMPKFVATHVSHVDLDVAKRVFVMERAHVEPLVAHGIAPGRISLIGEFDPRRRGIEIDDPIGKSAEAFEECYDRLRDCIVHYLESTDDFKATNPEFP